MLHGQPEFLSCFDFYIWHLIGLAIAFSLFSSVLLKISLVECKFKWTKLCIEMEPMIVDSEINTKEVNIVVAPKQVEIEILPKIYEIIRRFDVLNCCLSKIM